MKTRIPISLQQLLKDKQAAKLEEQFEKENDKGNQQVSLNQNQGQPKVKFNLKNQSKNQNSQTK